MTELLHCVQLIDRCRRVQLLLQICLSLLSAHFLRRQGTLGAECLVGRVRSFEPAPAVLVHRAIIVVVKFWYVLFRSYQFFLLSIKVFLDLPLYEGLAQLWFLTATTTTTSFLHS